MKRGPSEGVGYALLPGARSIWGEDIDLSFNPWALSAYPSLEQMQRRYGPGYIKGYHFKPAQKQYLEGLWLARKVPGLSVESHDFYSGRLTEREWNDFAMTEDHRVLRAWELLNAQTQPIDPADFDLTAGIAKLTVEQRVALSVLVQGMIGGAA